MKQLTNIKTARVTADAIKSLVAERDKIHIPSRYKHLNQHKGLRPGKLHGLIAPTGAGKSTYVRSILHDVACDLPSGQILVWLSEETIDSFLTEFSPNTSLTDDQMNSIVVMSELEMSDEARRYPQIFLQDYLEYNNIKFMIFDNITTSTMFYQEKSISEQGRFVSWVKGLTAKYGMATMLVAHTGAEVNKYTNKIINENDVRGSKTIVNYLEFLYILQQFHIVDKTVQTIRIEKHRGYNVDDKFYVLSYDKGSMTYIEDNPINFETFKTLFERMHARKK